MNCVYDQKTLACRYCGHVAKRLPTYRKCGSKLASRLFAVGDAVERALTSVGITKELVQKITRTKDCGCKARQKWLNQAGFAVQRKAAELVVQAAKVAGFG